MTVLDTLRQELDSLSPGKKQDTEATAHRLADLMSTILVTGYKSGFQDAVAMLGSYANDHFSGNKDFDKESAEIALKKLGEIDFPSDEAQTE